MASQQDVGSTESVNRHNLGQQRKERFVAGGAAEAAVTSGVVLGIRLRFHHHTPEQAAVCLAFHQPAANQLRGDDLRWTAEEGVRQGWEIVGDGRGGYGNGFGVNHHQCLDRAQTRSHLQQSGSNQRRTSEKKLQH